MLVSAEFQERERIVFTARGRSMVNVRRAVEDGAIGFSSIELLLIAFGNCSLGILLGQPEFEGVPLTSVTAQIEGDMATEHTRLAAIRATVRVATPDAERLAAALPAIRERVLDCPVCNSLVATKEITLELRSAASTDGAAAEPAGEVVLVCGPEAAC